MSFRDQSREKKGTFDMSAAKENFFDIKNTAQRLGVSEITVRRMIAERRIEHLRIGSGNGRILFTEAQISNYLKRCIVPALTSVAA